LGDSHQSLVLSVKSPIENTFEDVYSTVPSDTHAETRTKKWKGKERNIGKVIAVEMARPGLHFNSSMWGGIYCGINIQHLFLINGSKLIFGSKVLGLIIDQTQV
jgi:hypothetical protein